MQRRVLSIVVEVCSEVESLADLSVATQEIYEAIEGLRAAGDKIEILGCELAAPKEPDETYCSCGSMDWAATGCSCSRSIAKDVKGAEENKT